MIPVPYKVRGDHQIIHVGDHTYMWGDHMIPVPCKVRGTIRLYMWGDHTYMWGDHMIPVPYKVKEDHQIPMLYKVGGNKESLTVTRFPQWTLIVSYMWGDGVSLPPRTEGFNLVS